MSQAAEFEELQEICFAEVTKQFQELPEFKGKVVAISYCKKLVMEDLAELYQKRHFNFDLSYMAIPPDPESHIPLGVCLYVERLPVAYAIGDISLEREAFEIHFIETSNFFGNSELKSWISPLLSILCSLKFVIDDNTEHTIKRVCIINPVEWTIEPLQTMGFKYTNDYFKGNQASIMELCK